MMEEEFLSTLQDCEKIEKSLIVLICVTKSLCALTEELEKNDENENFLKEVEKINETLECVENIIELWLNKLMNKEESLENVIELIEESDMLNVFTNLYYRNLTEKFPKIEKILEKLFLYLPLSKDNDVPFYLYLMTISQKFKNENDENKFLTCKKINTILNTNLKFCLNNTKVKNCIKIIADTLYEVLKNKLSNELRQPIFELISTISFHYQCMNWFIKKGDEKKSFLLVSRLSLVEARMSLETNFENKLYACSLIIIEYSLKILLEEKNEESKEETYFINKSITEYLTSEDIVYLINAIKSLMQSILIYLKENEELILKQTNKENYDRYLISLRILCLYLVLENDLMKEDFEKIVNLLEKFLQKEIEEIKNLDLLKLILEALNSMIKNEFTIKDSLKNLIEKAKTKINF